MDESDDLDTYSGDTEHDMWVDFDYYENSGHRDVFFAESKRQTNYYEDNLDDYVENLNDWD